MKILSVILLFSIATFGQKPYTGKYDEAYRPQFHFTPPNGWMNDPNGLVYHNGKYHMFYQYYPDGIVWGPMHWGHAESLDLIHWKPLPVALYPDELGHIFSGSAVIDKDNTAGFGKDAMVAIYTNHNDKLWEKGQKNTESQSIAYSLDEGKTWTKYKGNPVLNNSGEQDFRDPKVFWNAANNQWTMALAAGDRIKIFSSSNLKNWHFESDFKPKENQKLGVWECPDLFAMRYGQEQKWIMLVSHGYDEKITNGHGTRYFVGSFDGKTFTPETPAKWIDYGPDFYAAVTFNYAPDGKRILLSWMSNWAYATKTPTATWRSAMSLPRELALEKDPGGWFLKQQITSKFDYNLKRDKVVRGQQLPLAKSGLPAQADIRFFCEKASNLTIKLSNKLGEEFKIELKDLQLTIDRSKSGKTSFSDSFGQAQNLPLKLDEVLLQVQLIVDESSVEILLNHGKYSLTSQVFPGAPYTDISIEGKGSVGNFFVSSVNGIWK